MRGASRVGVVRLAVAVRAGRAMPARADALLAATESALESVSAA